MIYHITARKNWEQALASGRYEAASLGAEGFIHASTAEQVEATANRFYHGQTGLVLLVIDPSRVLPEVRYDPVQLGEIQTHFPHIYGPLNLDAVVEVREFSPASNGDFTFHEKS